MYRAHRIQTRLYTAFYLSCWMSSQTTFPIDAAQLTSVITEGIFYGIYLVTFFACIRDLLFCNSYDTFVIKPRKDIHFNMLVGAFCLLFFATLDIAAGIRLNLRVFLYLRGNTVDDFGDIAYWVNVLKMVTFVGQMITGDAILLYRCWVIYGKDFWVISAPAMMLAAELVCGCLEIYTESTFGSDMTFVVSKQFTPYIFSVVALTFSMNVIVTSLIIWRIRSIMNNTKKLFPSCTRRSPLENAGCIMLDSGVLYTGSTLIMLITYIFANNASYLVSDCLVQIIGITFNVIINRVGRGQATCTRVFDEKPRARLSGQSSLHPEKTFSQPLQFAANASFADSDIERFSESPTVYDQASTLTLPTKTHPAQ
ncbi:hypothetical protein F5880DRAFT_1579230 [Lentinula raphanica]|nr:hypothetical protein F5880DRAFT_1579230 [Lentinula raphanica]